MFEAEVAEIREAEEEEHARVAEARAERQLHTEALAAQVQKLEAEIASTREDEEEEHNRVAEARAEMQLVMEQQQAHIEELQAAASEATADPEEVSSLEAANAELIAEAEAEHVRVSEARAEQQLLVEQLQGQVSLFEAEIAEIREAEEEEHVRTAEARAEQQLQSEAQLARIAELEAALAEAGSDSGEAVASLQAVIASLQAASNAEHGRVSEARAESQLLIESLQGEIAALKAAEADSSAQKMVARLTDELAMLQSQQQGARRRSSSRDPLETDRLSAKIASQKQEIDGLRQNLARSERVAPAPAVPSAGGDIVLNDYLRNMFVSFATQESHRESVLPVMANLLSLDAMQVEQCRKAVAPQGWLPTSLTSWFSSALEGAAAPDEGAREA